MSMWRLNRHNRAVLRVFAVIAGLVIPVSAGAGDEISKLSGLIGSWTCNTATARFQSEFRWILDRSRIEHDQRVRMFGVEHRVKEIIRWDPTSQSLRGWAFSRRWLATNTYREVADGWAVDVEIARQDRTVVRESKRIHLVDGRMIVETDKAPVKDFLKLEFQRSTTSDQARP